MKGTAPITASAGFWAAAWLIGSVGVLLYACLSMTDGFLAYTLDDPYIHLALAENVLRGAYGINYPEYSSPSSSILWPFLMASTLMLGMGTWGPFILNVGFAAASCWILGRFFDRHCLAFSTGKSVLLNSLLVAPILVLSINAAGLVLTGMEHSLHVMLTLLVLNELDAMGSSRKPSRWLPLLIIFLPLVRFEGLALSLATIVTLFWIGQRRIALQSIIGLTACGIAWLLFTRTLELPVMPSSVMVKSGVTSSAVSGHPVESLVALAMNVYGAVQNARAQFLAATLIACLMAAWAFRDSIRHRAMVLAPASAAIAGHLLVGQYGWWDRYEVYAIATALIIIFILFGLMRRHRDPRKSLLFIPLLAAVIPATFYASGTARTPLASANIYQQQYQMHRFATEFFPTPVAVNDLGYVSFNNDSYVLDLWGLGSERARVLRHSGMFTAEAMAFLATEQDVGFAMLYPEWFGHGLPAGWCPMAELRTSQISAASGRVVFFLIDLAREEEMMDALERFARTLPSGAILMIRNVSCPTASAS